LRHSETVTATVSWISSAPRSGGAQPCRSNAGPQPPQNTAPASRSTCPAPPPSQGRVIIRQGPAGERNLMRSPWPASLGLWAQNGLPCLRQIYPRRGWGWVLRGPRQHHGRISVAAALLATPALRHLARQAAPLPWLLSISAQRATARQSPARCAHRRPRYVTNPAPPRNPIKAKLHIIHATTPHQRPSICHNTVVSLVIPIGACRDQLTSVRLSVP